MRRYSKNNKSGLIIFVVILLLIIILFFVIFKRDVQLGPVQPGLVYKEYSTIMTGDRNWRVTDPNAGHDGAAVYIPNPILSINIGDLQNAVSAEALIDFWGGHVGTSDKKFRFNSNSWINIPSLTNTPTNPLCYMQQWNPIINIPLNHLIQGNNNFEGTSGGQVCYNFNWGQWGWYGMIVRVYYNSNKQHPTGNIVSPASGSTIGDNPVIQVRAESSVGIKRVDLIGYYDGFDEDGDGIYLDWHQAYFKHMSASGNLELQSHIGSDATGTGGIYEFVWDSSWIPDQVVGSVKFIARIQDNNNVWFVTEPAMDITLLRTDRSVKFYRAQNVPQKYTVRNNAVKSSTFNIPLEDDLSRASDAVLNLRTWNGYDISEPRALMKINEWETNPEGGDHTYAYTFQTIPLNSLRNGDNIIEFSDATLHHGVEILWPGPGVSVRYNIPATEEILFC